MRFSRSILLLMILALVACGGGGGGEESNLTAPSNSSLDGLNSLVLSPSDGVVRVGDTLQLTAMGIFSDGSTREVSSSLIWMSTGDGSVNSDGVVTGNRSGSVIVVATHAKSQISATATIAVSRYGTEGTVAQPVILSVGQPHAGEVNSGSLFNDGYSYYAVSVEEGGTYYIQLTDLLAHANLEVYRDAAFSDLICSPENYGFSDELCEIKATSSGVFYIAVNGKETGFSYDRGTSFTLNVTKGYGDEGTFNSPVPLSVGVPLQGEVGTGRSYYSVDVKYTGRYRVLLSGYTDDVDFLVLSQQSVLKSFSVVEEGDQKYYDIQADVDSWIIYVDGGGTQFGSPLLLTVIEQHDAYVNEGSLTAPLDISAGLPFTGQGTGESYYSAEITPGKSYEITLNRIIGWSDFRAYDGDSTFSSISCTPAYNDSSTRTCRIEPVSSNTLYLKVESTQMGADYAINVTELSYLSEGALDTPKVLLTTPTAGSPYVGQVDATTSFYQIPIAEKNATFRIGLAALSGEVDLEVYDDANLTTLLCSDFSPGLEVKSCLTEAVKPSTEALWVKVSGSLYGSRFDLTVDRFYYAEGSKGAPVDITGATPYRGQVAQGDLESDFSYYRAALTPGRAYVVSLTNYTDDIFLRIFEGDPTFSGSDCYTSPIGGVANCSITPARETDVYIQVMSRYSSYGSGFDISVTEVAYESEGSMLSPVNLPPFPILESVGVSLVTHEGSVGNGFSYYSADISQGYDYAGFRVALEQLSLDADLYVYSDPSFTNLLCASNNGSTMGEFCAFSGGMDTIYIKVDGTPSGSGAMFLLTIDHDYQDEGSPVSGSGNNSTGGAIEVPLLVAHQGEALANSYYRVPVIIGQNYTVKVSNKFDSTCTYVYTNDSGRFASMYSNYDSNNWLNDTVLEVPADSGYLYIQIRACGQSVTGTAYTLLVQ